MKPIVVLAISLATTAVVAGGKTKPAPEPAPEPAAHAMTQGQGQGQEQGQSQHSRAGAAAGAAADSVATGGSANGEVSVGGDSYSSSTRAYALALPMPLNVPQITPATAACTLSSSSGLAVGWNFYSHSSAKQIVDGLCVAERQAAAFETQCKYRTAAAIRYWIAQKATAAPELQRVEYTASTYEASDLWWQRQEQPAPRPTNLATELGSFLALAAATPYERERDLTIKECREPKVVYADRPAPTPVASPAPVPKPKAVRRTVRKPKPKPAPCPPGQQRMSICVAK